MVSEKESKRGFLTDEARIDIHRRYYNRTKTGETTLDIANAHNLGTRQWVAVIARSVEAGLSKGIEIAQTMSRRQEAA